MEVLLEQVPSPLFLLSYWRACLAVNHASVLPVIQEIPVSDGLNTPDLELLKQV